MSTEITRRRLIRDASVLAGAGALASAGLSRWVDIAHATETPLEGWTAPRELFRLGVASGDPDPRRIILWTRLAPDPLSAEPGAGMPARAVLVHFELAADENFANVVRRGVSVARPEQAHAVHVEVKGLRPDRWYWYRFNAAGQTSPVGRTRTAPTWQQHPRELRFAFASCQQWRDGFYTAHRAMAAEELDLVVFLGDYIYESSPLGGPRPDAIPPHIVPEPFTLDDYRRRYALYKMDPDLQAAHASCPWVCVFDDHEVDNNWADEIPQDPTAQPTAQFLARRAAAFQAFWEHQPLPRSARPSGIDMRVFRRVRWGDLAMFHVLDTRQYRSDQPTTVEEAEAPDRTMLGDAQEQWLFQGLDVAHTRWNVIANQVFMAENERTIGANDSFDFDNWDGYRASRGRLLDYLAARKPSNPFVITGDRHATWASDLTTDFANPAAPRVGAEIVGTSISSGGDSNHVGFQAVYSRIQPEQPHWKYFNDERGYIRCTVDATQIVADERVVSTVLAPSASVATRASFVVANGVPGISVA